MSTPLHVTVIGDALTDLDQPRLGSGWVSRLADLLTLQVAPRRVVMVDATEPATTVHRLRERWADDVLMPQPQPEVVLVHIGVSDAWGTHERNNTYAADPAGMVMVLEDLLDRATARAPRSRIILVEPVVNSIAQSVMRMGPLAATLAGYATAIAQLAARRGLSLLPGGTLVRAAKLARNSDEWLGTDPGGLDTDGNLLLAEVAAQLIEPRKRGPTTLRQDQVLLMIGDSITDSGRRAREWRPLGCGYARLLQGLLAARDPATPVTLINKGIGGDTILDIESRWERDVTPYAPHWLVLYTGINDMNSIYGGRAVQLLPPAYGEGLDRCCARARAVNPAINLVLASPFWLSRDDHPTSYRHEMITRLPDYSAQCARVATAHGARYVDLQAVMRGHMQHLGNRALGSQGGQDLVHPGELGSLAVAEAFDAALRA